MKIQFVSDLHLDFHNPVPPLADEVDVAVCAGDLAPVETGAVFYLAKEWAKARHILYVPGNHEYCGADIDAARATLWTDFKVDPAIPMKVAMWVAGKSNDDFRGAIQNGRNRFTPAESCRRHVVEREFIEDALGRTSLTGEPTVVITHHAPTPRSIAARFVGNFLTPCFASDLEPLIERYQPSVWSHGHMHDAVDICIGRTRVLCNPQGYYPERDRGGFELQLCVHIESRSPQTRPSR